MLVSPSLKPSSYLSNFSSRLMEERSLEPLKTRVASSSFPPPRPLPQGWSVSPPPPRPPLPPSANSLPTSVLSLSLLPSEEFLDTSSVNKELAALQAHQLVVGRRIAELRARKAALEPPKLTGPPLRTGGGRSPVRTRGGDGEETGGRKVRAKSRCQRCWEEGHDRRNCPVLR